MNCEHVRALFSDHVDGQLAVNDEERLGTHLTGCATCREALARYESSLQSVAGNSPSPPAPLAGRILTAARREGLVDGGRRRLVDRSRWLLPIAATMAVFALGHAAGRRAPAGGSPPAAFRELPAACVQPVPLLDLDGLRLARPAPQERSVAIGQLGSVHVPGRLSSRGPYYTRAAHPLDGNAGACLPLTAAYGDALVLVVERARGEPAGGFVVEPDQRRVLYTRVRWVQGGTAFQLEGRAESRELLALAEEIAARTRVDPG